MAVATLPILGGVTLASAKEQNYKRTYRGGTLQMANGQLVRDLVDPFARHSWRLRWEFITAAQLANIQAAWDGITVAAASFTTMTGTTYQVIQPDNAELEITLVVTAGGDIKYHVAMELVEQS
jgi:hypothetical protein